MWFIIEMDGGYSGDDTYPGTLIGPFPDEKTADKWWRKTYKHRWNYYILEVYPPT